MLRRKARRKLLPAPAAGRAWRILLPAALFVLAGLATWLVLAARERGRVDAPAREARPAAVSGARQKLYYQDLVFPRPESDSLEIYLWRTPTPRWDEEQVGRYWLDLNEITLEYLAGENDERIEELLAGVP
jgi:hypothetical protein